MIDYKLWISSARIKNRIKLEMMNRYNLDELWYHCFVEKDIGDIYGKKIEKELIGAWDIKKIDRFKRIIESEKIKTLSFQENKYPQKLKNIEDAPIILYYKGCIDRLNLNKNIAIVGSRKCTSYGRDVTRIISREISEYNINIISGMANGIDAEAHLSSLDNNGYTCAVLGSGIDVIYPKNNQKLYYQLASNGGIVSEFPISTEPLRHNFPMRNRIISGLSDLVLIVEGSEKSGSLITAGCALEQGRDVMAVPGSVFSNYSKGTNKLIKEGAYPFTGIDDILEILKIESMKSEKVKKIIDEKYKAIYNVLSDDPLHIDDIIKITKIDITNVYELLFEMQLNDLIKCINGNYYVRLKESI